MNHRGSKVIALGSTQSGETPAWFQAWYIARPSATAGRAESRRFRLAKSIVFALLVTFACSIFPRSGLASPPPYRSRLLDLLPSRWTDDSGRPLSLPDLRGRVVIITMAYTSCRRTCSTTILRLQEIQRILDAKGKSADFVIVGYDPGTDDAQAWAQFRKARNLTRPNWHFLTGSKSDTRRIAGLLGLDFWAYDDHIMHDFNILVLNAEGALDRQIGYEPVDLANFF